MREREAAVQVGGIPRKPDGSVDYAADFFGSPVNMTVSGQLQVPCRREGGRGRRALRGTEHRPPPILVSTSGHPCSALRSRAPRPPSRVVRKPPVADGDDAEEGEGEKETGRGREGAGGRGREGGRGGMPRTPLSKRAAAACGNRPRRWRRGRGCLVVEWGMVTEGVRGGEGERQEIEKGGGMRRDRGRE